MLTDDDLSRINETPVSDTVPDQLARNEANNLFKKSSRDNRRFGTINTAFIILVWLSIIIVVLLLAIRIAHMILPVSYLWLSKDQLSSINDFFVDGSIGGLVVGLLKSNILDKEKQ